MPPKPRLIIIHSPLLILSSFRIVYVDRWHLSKQLRFLRSECSSTGTCAAVIFELFSASTGLVCLSYDKVLCKDNLAEFHR
jgi:hypothetical protein